MGQLWRLANQLYRKDVRARRRLQTWIRRQKRRCSSRRQLSCQLESCGGVEGEHVPWAEIHSPKSSVHSVLPIKPYSSASQLARMIVRRGFQPCWTSSPRPRTISCIEAVPEEGSAAPRTQAVSSAAARHIRSRPTHRLGGSRR